MTPSVIETVTSRLEEQCPNQPRSLCSMELVVIRLGVQLAPTSIFVRFNFTIFYQRCQLYLKFSTNTSFLICTPTGNLY
jgi:hypothetical protein